nr:hypothetical protein [Tanacetum cinerariifolium]
MKGFETNDQADHYLGITSIKVNGKNAYKMKGKFLDDLHNNAFSGTNWEDAVEDIEYFLKIVDPIDLPNVNQDKLRVVIFPISLVADAWRWFNEIKGSITRAYIVGNMLCYQNLEWYDALKDSEVGKVWDDFKIRNGDRNGWEYENKHEDDERYELYGNETHELPVCTVRRFEMIKYSFRQDEEYVAVKEDEYEDLTSTSIPRNLSHDGRRMDGNKSRMKEGKSLT